MHDPVHETLCLVDFFMGIGEAKEEKSLDFLNASYDF